MAPRPLLRRAILWTCTRPLSRSARTKKPASAQPLAAPPQTTAIPDLIGSPQWAYIPRIYDGGRVYWRNGRYKLEAFLLVAREADLCRME